MKTIEFKKEKIGAYCEVSKDLLVGDSNIVIAENYIHHTLAVQLESFIMTRMNEKQFITVKSKRPTFLDWLLRKERYFDVEVNCREAMINPPQIKESILLYNANQL